MQIKLFIKSIAKSTDRIFRSHCGYVCMSTSIKVIENQIEHIEFLSMCMVTNASLTAQASKKESWQYIEEPVAINLPDRVRCNGYG